MIERALISSTLIITIIIFWTLFRTLHIRRASRVVASIRTEPIGPTLLYFSSDHCAPCYTQARYLVDVEQEFQNRVDFRHINTDHSPELAARYGVFTVPTILIVDDGGEVRHINYGLTGASKLASQVEKVI